MKKILSIIGARPQIIKASAISRAIAKQFPDRLTEVIVHTGQHYDINMSKVFFDELGIPEPDFNLHVGSGSHAVQTAAMIAKLEPIVMNEQPDYVLVYGDTNSTLAATIVAAKLSVPIVHVEAGLRSFNREMPEEINRISCDRAATLLFSPTLAGYNNLLKEGFSGESSRTSTPDHPGIFHCGDVMYDNSLHYQALAMKQSMILDTYDLRASAFLLATIHRPANTDSTEALSSIFRAFLNITESSGMPILLPLHPRTKKLMESKLQVNFRQSILDHPNIKLIPPVSFLDMIALESQCNMIFTDSGGVQKEAYFFNKPSVILRPETEWVEIVEAGTAILADADELSIIEAWQHFHTMSEPLHFPSIFGDGKAAEFICERIIEN